jgi:DNA topoisomerase-1
VQGANIRFCFRGKSGKHHTVEVADERIARVVKRCQELPGQELFEYLDDMGSTHEVNSSDVNQYLREVSGEDFTAKDFRTWAGTLLASEFLCDAGKRHTPAKSNRSIVRAIKAVSEKLGNTEAVCRKAYIHPFVLESAAEGSLIRLMRVKINGNPANLSGLNAREIALLTLLMRGSKKAANSPH